jgi:glycosyltransferase involved in cell wall biosynthesis
MNTGDVLNRGAARTVQHGSGSDESAFAVDPARVLFVWDHLGYPNGATHGLTRYCLNVLPRLNRGAVRLTVCFLREEHPAGEELRRLGVEPIFLSRSKWDPRAVFDVMRLIRRHDIEVVHARGYKGILAGRTAGRLLGCGVIIHLGDMFRLSPPIRMLLRITASWTDVAQCVSRAICEHAHNVLAVPRDRVELLYNGVVFDQFRAPADDRLQAWRREHGLPPGARLIGVVGRLSPEKGHARLLRQLPRILVDVPGAHLVVVGDGPLRGELRDLTNRLGLDCVVTFLGQQHDVLTIMAALDVLAVPSDHEGFSYVTLEALMVGTPVVGTRVGGLPEVLADGRYGRLFDPRDEDQLGDALSWALTSTDAARSMAASAQAHLRQFDIAQHIDRQRDIYLRLSTRVRQRRERTTSRSGPA